MTHHDTRLFTTIAPTVLSLFAGAGGCAWGFARAGMRVVAAVEKDADAAATFRRNFPATRVYECPIETISARALPRTDVLIGGPPCQGFSTAGVRASDDPCNTLWAHFLRILRETRPRFFFFENVAGILAYNTGRTIADIQRALRNEGYFVRVDKLCAVDYGAPQRRVRVFVTGNAMGGQHELPPHSAPHTVGETLHGLPPAFPHNTPLDALRAYTAPASTEWECWLRGGGESVSAHVTPRFAQITAQRIALLQQGQSMRDLPEELWPPSYKRRAYRRVSDGTPSAERGGPPTGIRRLCESGQSLTVTTGATFIHPHAARPLTLRELARLQTFPDTFEFEGGTKTARLTQIANAIPPLWARQWGASIVTFLRAS